MPDHVDLDLHLLDRQVVDVEHQPVARVDDVELAVGADGALRVTAVLVGPEALGPRLGGRLGRWVTNVGRRLRPELAEPPRIPIDLVEDLGGPVRLSVHRDDLDLPRSEAWFREHVVDRLPGSQRT